MHLPRSIRRRDRREYMLFQAASEGCVSCVRRMLEQNPKVDPNVHSEIQNYSVHDFAEYAAQLNIPGASSVQAYLTEHWSESMRLCKAMQAGEASQPLAIADKV